MLVRADAIPVVEMVKAAERVDVETAALWLHMGLYDALGEMIDEARPEIERVWKSVVAARSDEARRLLVRSAVERRVEGDEIDDVVKAAAGLSLVRGYVAKDVTHRTEEEYNETPQGHAHPKGARGRFAPTKGEKATYDAMAGLTTHNQGLQDQARGVADELQNGKYGQMRVVGNALVASGHPKAMVAGGAVRIAAEVGPSAEEVLGSHLRRAAYRYRGTEKRPDRGLIRQTKEAQAYVAGLSATPHTPEEQRAQANMRMQLDERKPGEWAKGSVALRVAQSHESEDQLEMRATGDVATAYLMRQLPTDREAFLSQEAGRTPPSVGVLIDADGDVVSEAMGFNGDHYVPFDLKNLKRLKGGSYVRTRALGGPTSEDIYTGLLTGARQMTVVSRSGVFTVEFDPDLRGGRRYSDKARQMVDRYSRLLDVVEGGRDSRGEPIYTQDIPEDRKRELRRTAMEAADYDEDEADVIYNRRLKQERAKAKVNSSYTEDDLDAQVDDQLQEWVRNQAKAGQAPGRTEIGRAREQIRTEVRDAAREQRTQGSVERLRLNAEGYYRAMQSLRREFPYYIRDVSYESLPDFEDKRRTRQMGEAPLGFGAPNAAASRTHVRRRALVPAEQERAYRGTSEEDKPAAAAEASSAPTGPKGDAGGAAGATFEQTLRNEQFQDRLAGSLEALHVVNATEIAGVEPLEDERGAIPSRQGALGLNAVTYMKWLVDPRNEETRGKISGVSRFLTEKATDDELDKVSSGLDAVMAYDIPGPQFSKEKLEATRTTVEAIAHAKDPYAKTGGSPVLHEPDRESPKPYPFPEVVANAMATDERFNKARRQDENVTEADLAWAQGMDDKRAAAHLRLAAQEIKSAKSWGEARIKAKQEGVDAADFPEKPADVGDITKDEAEELAKDPATNSRYKQLGRRQRAWAWAYTQRLRDALHAVTGGGAAPKLQGPGRPALESGETAKRARRVVWHDPDDPLSRALAKRLGAAR